MKYSVMFDNNSCLTFECESDVDLHKLDHTKPIVFDNIFVNTDHVIYIQKEDQRNG